MCFGIWVVVAQDSYEVQQVEGSVGQRASLASVEQASHAESLVARAGIETADFEFDVASVEMIVQELVAYVAPSIAGSACAV